MDDIKSSINVKGRDNARTPFQWDNSPYSGFSTHSPWIEVNRNYKEINLKNQLEDKDSILEYYRKLIKFRRNSKYKELIEKGTFKLIFEEHLNIFAYERDYLDQKIVILCNFYDSDIILSKSFKYNEIIISNIKQNELEVSRLRPYEAIVLDISKK